jgi:hypothetical protein
MVARDAAVTVLPRTEKNRVSGRGRNTTVDQNIVQNILFVAFLILLRNNLASWQSEDLGVQAVVELELFRCLVATPRLVSLRPIIA